MKTLDEFRAEIAKRRRTVIEKRASYPPPPVYVRLTQPCLSRVFKTYLKAGSKGQVVGRANGKLSVLFGGTLAVIAEDSPLIEVVK